MISLPVLPSARLSSRCAGADGLALSTALIVNALAGGAIVAVLFLVAMQLSTNLRAALLMAIAAGLATLVMSEATHFYQHELDALMTLLAFWFFSVKDPGELSISSLFGGASLGVAILARPDAVPAAVIIWLYGAMVAWKHGSRVARSNFANDQANDDRRGRPDRRQWPARCISTTCDSGALASLDTPRIARASCSTCRRSQKRSPVIWSVPR